MRCTSPRTVGFLPDGKTICWSQKNYSKEYATFQLPCGKCIDCRLDYARQWAIRCVHEAQMHPKNCFITLTYSEENLKSDRLQYVDFQLFMKRLRKHIFTQFLEKYGKENWLLLSKEERKTEHKSFEISLFVTGEYGDKEKRPHWHACIFNWAPEDMEYYRSNERGDKIYKSKTLDKIWGLNDPKKRPNEVGSVTFHSAGYCARYAAKKLVHGNDGTHDYEPISKKSSKLAIGKKWLEKFWPDVFNYGHIILPDGATCSVPRYYEKWLKVSHPNEWNHYVTHTKLKKIGFAEEKGKKIFQEDLKEKLSRSYNEPAAPTHAERRKIILEQKFKLLQEKLKL